MNAYADTGFLAALFLPEKGAAEARAAVMKLTAPLPMLPLTVLELRNSLNLGVARKRITFLDRDALWRQFEAQCRTGFFAETAIPSGELHRKARELSDQYTPKLATRSLDLLHVAAALLLNTKLFLSFDERQREAARGEGLRINS